MYSIKNSDIEIATSALINSRRYSFSILAKKGTVHKLICNIQATSSVNTVSKKTIPATIALMNLPGSSMKLDNITPPRRPCFFLSSMLSRFALMKAVSIPAKNIKSNSATDAMIIKLVSVMK